MPVVDEDGNPVPAAKVLVDENGTPMPRQPVMAAAGPEAPRRKRTPEEVQAEIARGMYPTDHPSLLAEVGQRTNEMGIAGLQGVTDAADTVTFGVGKRAGALFDAAVGGKSYTAARNDYERSAQQARDLSPNTAAYVAPLAQTPLLALSAGAQAVSRLGKAAQVLAPGFVFGAGEGIDTAAAGGSASDVAKSVIAPVALSAFIGGGAHLLGRTAPARIPSSAATVAEETLPAKIAAQMERKDKPAVVVARILKEIGSGVADEEGQVSAKARVRLNIGKRAGEEGENAIQIFSRHPKLLADLEGTAGAHPARALKHVQSTTSPLNQELDGFYGKIDVGVGPKVGNAEVGGVSPKLIDDGFAKSEEAYKAAGDDIKMKAVQNVRASLARLFGDTNPDGSAVVIPFPAWKRIPAEALRTFRRNLGSTAFANDPLVAVPIKAEAQQRMYGDLSSAIEKAAADKGLNVDRLKQLNNEISFFIPIEQALAERTAKQPAGMHNLSSTLIHAFHALHGGGAATLGGIPVGAIAGEMLGGHVGAAVGGAIPLAYKGGKSVVHAAGRRIDLSRALEAMTGKAPAGAADREMLSIAAPILAARFAQIGKRTPSEPAEPVDFGAELQHSLVAATNGRSERESKSTRQVDNLRAALEAAQR